MVPHVLIEAVKKTRAYMTTPSSSDTPWPEVSDEAGFMAVHVLAYNDDELHSCLPPGASWNPPAPGTIEQVSPPCPACEEEP
jgi:hypothetical protein